MVALKKPKMNPHAFHGHIPLLPKDLVDRRTPTDQLFSLAHFGIPIIEAEEWQLEINGLIKQPRTFSFADIKSFPKRTIGTIHQCAGSPLDPTAPKRRIANVEWAGADLRDFLGELDVNPNAKYLWSYGPDYGKFDKYYQDFYLKDLSLERVAQGDILLAYELNGEPLPHKHGYPVRLLVPGYYGTNSVKWICRMSLSENRADSVFTTELYTDPVVSVDGKIVDSIPVWEIAPECVIVEPATTTHVEASGCNIWGWAWAAAGVQRVELSMDDGKTWQSAKLEDRTQWSWQKFMFDWRPETIGPFTIIARATDTTGKTQPMNGARNAVHSVRIDVS